MLIRKDINTVGVVGAGNMGAGIAQTFAESGFDVIMHSRTPVGLQRGLDLIRLNQRQFQENGLITKEKSEQALSKISTTTDIQDLSDSDFINENAPEDLEIKRSIFSKLDQICGQDIILSTDTSGLPITEIARATKRPERVVGMHWWNPPHIMPLVEIIKGEKTEDEALRTVRDLCPKIGKKPVMVKKDAPGFVANRMQFAIAREAYSILHEGIADAEDIDLSIREGLGFRYSVIGPLQTFDIAGLDTVYKIAGYLLKEIDNSTEPPKILKELVENGHYGVKTGKGVYDYASKTQEEVISERNRGLIKMLKMFRSMKSESD